MSAIPVRICLTALRVLAGPLTLAAFCLPWFHGPGIMSATELSGLRLLGLTESLTQLDLTGWETAALWATRVGLAVLVAAGTWLTLLALPQPQARLYRGSGWFVVIAAAAALVAGGIPRRGRATARDVALARGRDQLRGRSDLAQAPYRRLASMPALRAFRRTARARSPR